MRDWIDSLFIGALAGAAGFLVDLIMQAPNPYPVFSPAIGIGVVAGLFATGTVRLFLWIVDGLTERGTDNESH